MAITYGDLPAADRTRRTVAKAGGGSYTVEGRPVVLLCPRCLAEFSACRGDYWDRPRDAVIKHCGRPMKLIRWDACTHHDVTEGELKELRGE